MSRRSKLILVLALYFIIFFIGLFLVIDGSDWRGYVALISTPLLHTLIKAFDRYLNAAKQIK